MAERWFSQWCVAEWLSFSDGLCFFYNFFLSLLQTLSLCELFLNPLFFYLSYYSFILHTLFVTLQLQGFGVCPSAEGLSMGIKSALFNFVDGSLWTVNSCFSFHPQPSSVITLIIGLSFITMAIAIIFNHRPHFDHSICRYFRILGKHKQAFL